MVEKAIVASGGRIVGRCGTKSAPRIRAEVNEATLKRLIEMDEIRWLANPKPKVLFNDVAAGIMGVTNVWQQDDGVVALGLTGKGQYITTSDSGIDTGDMSTIHRDFTNNLVGFSTLSYRSGSQTKKTLDHDVNGHGTHTAGSLVGNGTMSAGKVKGIACGAKLWAWFCMDEAGDIWTPNYVDDMFRPSGLKAGTACIHSASWGSNDYSYTEESEDIDSYCWENPDFLPVFAAGNDFNQYTISSQAQSKNVLTVGSSQSYRPSESSSSAADYKARYVNSVSGFSSKGPAADGRMKPDVVAPGSWILSTRSTLAPDSGFWGLWPQNAAYAFMGGTSMACPLTAGCAALVREWLITRREFASPSAALVKAILTGGATDLYRRADSNVTSPVPNAQEGWGRVNLAESIEPDGGQAVFLADYLPFHADSNVVVTVTTTNASPLAVQLVWIDYPGRVNRDSRVPVLVNDLNLKVEHGESGREWLGNGGAEPDNLNNVEGVRLASAEAGVYSIVVDGRTIPHPSGEGGAAALYVRGAFDPAAVKVTVGGPRTVTLTVSLAGAGTMQANPPEGVHSYREGAEVTISAARYAMKAEQYGTESVRYPFLGFVGTGDVPTSGTTNELTFTITRDSSIVLRWDAAHPEYRYRSFVRLYGYADGGYSFGRKFYPRYDRYSDAPYQVDDRWIVSNAQFTVALPTDIAADPQTLTGYHSTDDWWSAARGTWTYRFAQAFYARTDADEWQYLYSDRTGMPWPSVEITMDEGCDLILDYYEQNDCINVADNRTWAPTWWILRYMWWFDGSEGFDFSGTGDVDGDGFTNLEEYRIDTNPLSAASRLAMTAVSRTNVAWTAGREVRQVLEARASLTEGQWRPVYTNDTGATEKWYNTQNKATNLFYRVNVPKEMQR